MNPSVKWFQGTRWKWEVSRSYDNSHGSVQLNMNSGFEERV